MAKDRKKPQNFSNFREKLHEIIFEAETKEGRLFDIILLIAIVFNISILMFESVPGQSEEMAHFYYVTDWFFTIFFTIEYGLRLYTVYNPAKYASSFFGVIDLLSVLPTYLSVLFPGVHSLMIIRALRLLRLFRIFKLHQFVAQGQMLRKSIIISIPKILIFLFNILILVFIFGSLMFVIENGVNEKFDSIPRSIYWAIITVTTVGYGDISPVTTAGQFIAAFTMLIGYAVLAVPTGIMTSSMLLVSKNESNTISCKECGLEGHATDAEYCKKCGSKL
ncbi:MAG: ion transporter [Saprospiraceae bacterium]|nr:ion transporter [Saprospiraceae bacterium]